MNELQKLDPAAQLALYSANDQDVGYRAFTFLMDALIGVNQTNRREIDRKSMDPMNFVRDFCTVYVNIGRRVGKTTYLMNRAEGKRDTILVVATNDYAYQVRDRKSLNVVVASRLKHPLLSIESRDMPYREILVDEPALCHARGALTLESIYAAYVSPKIDQTFIFLGTS